MRPTWIAFAAGLLPIVGVGLSYGIAAGAGDVPTCNPFFDGCTSISSAGRHLPASLVFNATLLPAAALNVVFWLVSLEWLKALGATPGKGLYAIPVLGVFAGLFLVVYVSFLGSHGELNSLLRRAGVTVYFGFTYLAQAFITRALWRLDDHALRLPVWIMFLLLVAQLILGLISVFDDAFAVDTDQIERIIEWNFGLLMMLFFVACGFAWYCCGFILRGGSNR